MGKLKEFLNKLSANGIPIMLLRDPIKGSPSISFSFLLICGILCIASGSQKISEALGGLNFEDYRELLIITSCLYFGRQFQKIGDSKNSTVVEDK